MEEVKDFLTYTSGINEAANSVNEICALICREKRIPDAGEVFNIGNGKMTVKDVVKTNEGIYIIFAGIFTGIFTSITTTIRCFKDRDFVDVCPVSVCMN